MTKCRSMVMGIVMFFCFFASADRVPKASSPSGENTDDFQGVINLDKRNFDSSISDGSIWLIEFYSPWCGHCKNFAPTYEQVAAQLHQMNKGKDRKIKVGKVDGSKESALSMRFSITGFPTFFLIDNWNIYEFSGKRSKEAMIKFANKKLDGQEPIPFVMSPFGPFGQIRAAVMNAGTKILDTYEYLTKTMKIPKTLAALIMASFGVVFGTTVVIVVGLMLLPKPKVD